MLLETKAPNVLVHFPVWFVHIGMLLRHGVGGCRRCNMRSTVKMYCSPLRPPLVWYICGIKGDAFAICVVHISVH